VSGAREDLVDLVGRDVCIALDEGQPCELEAQETLVFVEDGIQLGTARVCGYHGALLRLARLTVNRAEGGSAKSLAKGSSAHGRETTG